MESSHVRSSSRHCPDVPRVLSSDPDKYPIVSRIASLAALQRNIEAIAERLREPVFDEARKLSLSAGYGTGEVARATTSAAQPRTRPSRSAFFAPAAHHDRASTAQPGC